MIFYLQFLTILCTWHRVQQSFIVLQNFQVEGGVGMWSSNFLVEVAVKFGVLLAVGRNEARKNPINPTSCLVLTCAFDAKKHYWKRDWTLSKFWGDLYPTTPSLYTVGFTPIAIDLPKRKIQKWTPTTWILRRGISYVTLGLTGPHLSIQTNAWKVFGHSRSRS